MGKIPKWQKKLTRNELCHVKEWCGGTLAGIKRTRRHQKADEDLFPEKMMPCWDCKQIAKKLGIE